MNHVSFCLVRLALCACLLTFCTFAQGTAHAAPSFSTLYNFTYPDGDGPSTKLVQGSDGSFYGATSYGGTFDEGTIFKVTASGTLTTLYNFNFYGLNGLSPSSALVQGSDGNFYGTTNAGGTSDDGTVFKITPTGTLTTLVNFNGTNGYFVFAPLIQGSDGNFYGTTGGGGATGDGTVFKITPSGALTTLYSFSGTDSYGDNSDGAEPLIALVQGTDGNFYGTTKGGGTEGNGTLFKITPNGALTSLYSFGSQFDNGSNYDGLSPNALVQGSDGSFYGTAAEGGAIQRRHGVQDHVVGNVHLAPHVLRHRRYPAYFARQRQ